MSIELVARGAAWLGACAAFLAGVLWAFSAASVPSIEPEKGNTFFIASPEYRQGERHRALLNRAAAWATATAAFLQGISLLR